MFSNAEWIMIALTAGAMLSGAANAVLSLKIHSEIADLKVWALDTFERRRIVRLDQKSQQRKVKA